PGPLQPSPNSSREIPAKAQETVFGAQLLAGRLCFLRVPGEIHALVVLGSREGAQAGGDGVVAPRLDLDVVGWVRVDQVRGGAVVKHVKNVLFLPIRWLVWPHEAGQKPRAQHLIRGRYLYDCS